MSDEDERFVGNGRGGFVLLPGVAEMLAALLQSALPSLQEVPVKPIDA